MKYVIQLDDCGCGIACLAMVGGMSYRDACDYFTQSQREKSGITTKSLDKQLVRIGFSVARIFKEKGQCWPPVPFAPVHIASVRVRATKVNKNPAFHYVVWDEDGVVWDPDIPSMHSLEQYGKVLDVAGLYRIPTYKIVRLTNG